MNINILFTNLKTWFFSNGLKIIFIIILAFIISKLLHIVSFRLFSSLRKQKEGDEYKKRTDTMSSMFHYIISIGILILAFIMILGELGIEIGPILAAAGILGLAVGFGAQSLVKDVISGFFIFLEDQIRVGDVVQIADRGGLVEKVNLKMTILRDLAGNVHYIPNGNIDVVMNMTKDYSRYVFHVGVAYREDVDEVMAVMKQVDEELRVDAEFKDDILEPLEILGLDQFAESALIIKARTTTKPIKQWRVGREFNRRLKKKFDELDIEIPFPHRTLYMGEDKQGQSPPLYMTTQQEIQERTK